MEKVGKTIENNQILIDKWSENISPFYGLSTEQITALHEPFPKAALVKDKTKPHLSPGVNVGWLVERLNKIIKPGNWIALSDAYETYNTGKKTKGGDEIIDVSTNVSLFVNGYFVTVQPGDAMPTGGALGDGKKSAWGDGLKRCCFVGLGMMGEVYKHGGDDSAAGGTPSDNENPSPQLDKKQVTINKILKMAEAANLTEAEIVIYAHKKHGIDSLQEITPEIAKDIGKYLKFMTSEELEEG